MILFKPEHVPLILNGQKTQTRRTGQRRWTEGTTRKCYTRPPFSGGEPFTTVRILRVWQEPLHAISTADAIAEGYPDREKYLMAFMRINRVPPTQYMDVLGQQVWCVEFEVVKERVT